MPVPIGLKKLAKELYNDINEKQLTMGAAALAYYFLLSLFPAAIVFMTLLGFLPTPDLSERLIDYVREFLPAESAGLVETTIRDTFERKRGGLLSFGILASLWAGSNGLYAVMQELNRTYDVKEARPFWKGRLVALGLLFVFAFLIIGALLAILFGEMLVSWLQSQLQFGSFFYWFGLVLQWGLVIFAMLLGYGLIYYFGPNVQQKFRFITAGSVFSVAAMAVLSYLFKLYVEGFGNYNASYGSIGAVIILMFWLYIAGLVLLVGSQINAIIEHYSHTGKKRGERAFREIAKKPVADKPRKRGRRPPEPSPTL